MTNHISASSNGKMLWGQLQLLDIRYKESISSDGILTLRLPANTFLFSLKGKAQVFLEGWTHSVAKFHVLHATKGVCLDIEVDELFAYFLIYYRLDEPTCKRSWKQEDQYVETNNLFAFVPQHPLTLYGQAERIYQAWKSGDALGRFEARAYFHPFVFEIVRQLQQESIQQLKPDIVMQTIRYLYDHYAMNITLKSIAESLNYNIQYLSKRFKQRTGTSPIDFLIKIRIEQAQQLLMHTDATVQEVAESVGYSDLFYFIRIFKKHTGMVPGKFRAQYSGRNLPHSPSIGLRLSMVNLKPHIYTNFINDNDYQYRGENEVMMYKSTKAPLGVALLLCMMILISACGAQPAAINTGVVKEYQHDMGATVVSENLNKIAAADYRILDMLYALNIVPYATTTYNGSTQLPYMDSEEQNEQLISLGDRINLEAAAEAQPDLIIARHIEPEVYEQLSKVSPVVVFRGDRAWRDEMLDLAEVVNKQTEAEAWLTNYDTKAAELKDKLAGVIGEDETFMFIRLQKDMQVASPKVHFAATLSEDLGLNAVPQLYDMEKSYDTLSLEILPELNPDHIFITIGKSTVTQDEEAEKLFAEMEQLNVWNDLKAVQNNNVHILPQWVFGDYPNIKLQSLELVEQILITK